MDNNFMVSEGCASQYQDKFNVDGFRYIVAYFIFTIDKIFVRDPEQAAKKLSPKLDGVCDSLEITADGRLQFIIEVHLCQVVQSSRDIETIMFQAKQAAADIFQVETDCPSFHLSVDIHGVYIGPTSKTQKAR
ncbi:MAG: hypothetical protein K0Q73_7035 [Paenibacillus sp.]|nr:hypothetical protein [Paenibacillus sp.]